MIFLVSSRRFVTSTDTSFTLQIPFTSCLYLQKSKCQKACSSTQVFSSFAISFCSSYTGNTTKKSQYALVFTKYVSIRNNSTGLKNLPLVAICNNSNLLLLYFMILWFMYYYFHQQFCELLFWWINPFYYV